MNTEILVFDPLNSEEVSNAKQELDKLLGDGYEIVTSLGGNRPIKIENRGMTYQSSEHSPVARDYIVLILHKPNLILF